MKFHAYSAALAVAVAVLVPVRPVEARPSPARPGSLVEEMRTPGHTVRATRQTAPTRRRGGPAHTVTVRVLDREGRPPAGEDAAWFSVFDLATGAPVTGEFVDGVGSVEVPSGTYRVGTWIRVPEPGGPDAKALMVHAWLEVNADATVVLDARATNKVRVGLDAPDTPDERLALGDVIVPMTTSGQRHAFGLPLEDGVYVSPATGVPLRLLTTWTRGGSFDSPYRYTTYDEFEGRIPDRPVLNLRARDLAEVRTAIPGQGAAMCHAAYVGPELRDMGVGIAHGVTTGRIPATVTSYLTPGVRWRVENGLGGTDCAFNESDQGTDLFPKAGLHLRTRNTVPLVPVPWNWEGRDLQPGVLRREGRIDVNLSLFSDGRGDNVGPRSAPWEDGHITGSTTLSRDGEKIGTSEFAGYGSFAVPEGPGRFVLETDATRAVPWSPLGTRAHAVWRFASGAAVPPLMTVRYDAPLDTLGRAAAGRPFRVAATVLTPPGVTPREVRRIEAQASYDDGATWRPVTVRGRNLLLDHPAGPGHVSLRVTVTDAAGDSVTQTTIRAYALR